MENKLADRDKKNRLRLHASLKLFGIKQTELAEAVGISKPYLSELFTGKKNAPETFKRVVETLKRIRRA